MAVVGNSEDPDFCALVLLPNGDVATAAWIDLPCPHSTASVKVGFHSAWFILILWIIILIISAYACCP